MNVLEESIGYLIMVIGAIIIGLTISFIFASFEAASYNKFCDTPVTAWDALFLDLRIDECG